MKINTYLDDFLDKKGKPDLIFLWIIAGRSGNYKNHKKHKAEFDSLILEFNMAMRKQSQVVLNRAYKKDPELELNDLQFNAVFERIWLNLEDHFNKKYGIKTGSVTIYTRGGY